MDGKRDLLRHSLATLAYRSRGVVRNAPPGFGDFSVGEGARTPHEIISHMSDLMCFTLEAVGGEASQGQDASHDFEEETERFLGFVRQLSDTLSKSPLEAERIQERLLQGPISDALTHVGQLALLRRLAGSPVPGENFFKAHIHAEDLESML